MTIVTKKPLEMEPGEVMLTDEGEFTVISKPIVRDDGRAYFVAADVKGRERVHAIQPGWDVKVEVE